MGHLKYILLFLFFGISICSCKDQSSHVPNNDAEANATISVEGGTFVMGNGSAADNRPMEVWVPDLEVHAYEVCNRLFEQFVNETGYVTLAERVGGSYVFDMDLKKDTNSIPGSPWWKFVYGANWKHPEGPESEIAKKPFYPVIHIAYEDACAYCNFLGMRLPTEAEREYLAKKNGNAEPFNYWQGIFPANNTIEDGMQGVAPVGTYAPGKLGLYDLRGNVWEWCADYYHSGWYELGTNFAPSERGAGPPRPFDPQDPYTEVRVIRGGSYLCADNFCSGYEVSNRMRSRTDQSFGHIGFRCVKTRK